MRDYWLNMISSKDNPEAEIICTINDFHKFIGPRIRNQIQAITKKRKKELNHICDECKQNKELEAAHIKGNSRKDIINNLLINFMIDRERQLIRVNLKEFERLFIESHKPIDKYFRFLCSESHVKYDKD